MGVKLLEPSIQAFKTNAGWLAYLPPDRFAQYDEEGNLVEEISREEFSKRLYQQTNKTELD